MSEINLKIDSNKVFLNDKEIKFNTLFSEFVNNFKDIAGDIGDKWISFNDVHFMGMLFDLHLNADFYEKFQNLWLNPISYSEINPGESMSFEEMNEKLAKELGEPKITFTDAVPPKAYLYSYLKTGIYIENKLLPFSNDFLLYISDTPLK